MFETYKNSGHASPELSDHFASRQPSAIRLAQIEFMKRSDTTIALNTAIGNVSLPMHPAMRSRLDLTQEGSPFKDGVMKYTATVGEKETQDAFANIIHASSPDARRLFVQITDGGSAAMELVILGCCGPAGEKNTKPLLVIDPAYTNYISMAERLGRGIVSMRRVMQSDGKYSLPDMTEVRRIIEETNPGALLVIPYDNPTGHFGDHETMVQLARLCIEYNLWMISDEAYRELYYTEDKPSSVWSITEEEAPGITGRRISIETASKVWNACGLRIGALVTDNELFHVQSVAENTANLCPNVTGQYIFGALAHESHENMQKWFSEQRGYYKDLMVRLTDDLKLRLPGVIVSSPDASIYSVVDVKDIAKPGFDANKFVLYCAQKGSVDINGKKMTLLVAPMDGFYNIKKGEENPGKTQMRIAYVCPPDEMALVPELFEKLFEEYQK